VEIIAEYSTILLVLAIAFGLFMAWGVGANDVANAMGTSVGSGAITIKQAIIIAIIFEFAGAVLAGGEVTATIRKGILDASLFTNEPHLLIYGMLASLLSAGVWLMIASSLGWPVSTTHSIVGAIVGFGAVGVGVDAVAWGKVGKIAMSWVVSPCHIIRPMCKCHCCRCNNHQHAKHSLHRGKVKVFILIGIKMNTANNDSTNNSNHCAKYSRQ
jgi:PiT family inorganic phosphate transporter